MDNAELWAVGDLAERWFRAVLVDENLRGVWPETHPAFREKLIREFLESVHGAQALGDSADLRAGFESKLADLVTDQPVHTAWSTFSREMVLNLRKMWPDFEGSQRVPAVALEDGGVVVPFIPPSARQLVTASGAGASESMNVLMRFDGERWLMAGMVPHVSLEEER